MFWHEAVDRHDTIVSLYSVTKNIRESRDNIGLSKYGSTSLNTGSERYTDFTKVANSWQVMILVSDALRFQWALERPLRVPRRLKPAPTALRSSSDSRG
jgi:hypothetical protein